MRQLPSFSALRAFEAAARLESFALAAAELHLSASAVSHQMRALEAQLGQGLFTRRSGQGWSRPRRGGSCWPG
ncbi:LysR family transcriptional regulator [Dankookia sp. P2]|uniref:LysR family transcriptional regulator n=1 Tax=Dankookia sp. P2 TaxID=3423955 RepID=UPI003D663EC4